jgi:Protein of unknown function (DUF4235)
MGPAQKLLRKLYIGVIGAVTTIATQRLLKAGWKLATGNEPPAPTDPNASVVTAVSWAMASAAGVAVSQLLAQRMAARYWEKDTEDAAGIEVKI